MSGQTKPADAAQAREARTLGGRRRDPLADHRRAAEVVATAVPGAGDVLDALSGLANVRLAVDRLERELIGSARDLGVTWPEIATALGLGSRQAAEQRWLRLSGESSRDPARIRAAKNEQRNVDDRYGPAVAALRGAALEAYRRIEADRSWDGRHHRAELARTSLAAAVSAPPGALYALCRKVADDLEAMDGVDLPPDAAAAVRRLRDAVHGATPTDTPAHPPSTADPTSGGVGASTRRRL